MDIFSKDETQCGRNGNHCLCKGHSFVLKFNNGYWNALGVYTLLSYGILHLLDRDCYLFVNILSRNPE